MTEVRRAIALGFGQGEGIDGTRGSFQGVRNDTYLYLAGDAVVYPCENSPRCTIKIRNLT